jgi:teichuronic acid biosynthesis glycosyltransferase TuaC
MPEHDRAPKRTSDSGSFDQPRVLVFTNMYPTHESPGDGTFVQEQVESLRGLGLSIDVVTIRGPSGGTKYVHGFVALRRALAARRYDLIHAHYGLSGAIAAAQRRVPVLTTFHGSDTYIQWQRYISRVVARVTTPIFVTEEGAARLGVESATVIPCGIDTTQFRPIDRGEARRLLGWDQERHYVLLPGSRKQRVKRADLFDAVLERARLEVGDLVGVSLEQTPRADVALIMNAVNLTLMTSESEGSPVAIKESLACSTPVVSVPVGDVPRMIAGLPGCTIVRRDPEALSNAVLAALDTDRRPELRERVLPYAVEFVARRIAAVYQSVLARPTL